MNNIVPLIHTFHLFCGQAASVNLTAAATLCYVQGLFCSHKLSLTSPNPKVQTWMQWGFFCLFTIFIFGKYTFSMHVLWVSSRTVRNPSMKGKLNNQKRHLATVLHPLLPSLWIQQEMPEAEPALWLFFDSSNRWFPMEQVSLLICPTHTFFFRLTSKWHV